ncbi:MAG: hypothetical protein AB8H86_34325 [Polyangiales bacterium]
MWQIHSWDQERKTGTVRAPHVRPLPFGAAQNPDGTTDFVVGEEVVVSLACDGDDERVESVREVRPRPQPEGTHCADFDVLADFCDLHVHMEGEPLVLWLDDVCARLPGALVTFVGVAYTDLDEEDDWSRPLLRFASKDEVGIHKVPAHEGTVAYCIVDQPTRRWDTVRVPRFIVAESVSVELLRP